MCRTTPHRKARPLRRLLIVLVLACVPILIGAPAAHAHNTLIASDPESGAVLASAPAAIRLTFDQAVREDFAHVSLTLPEGGGTELSVHAEGDAIVAAAPPGELPAGAYTVGYRVVSNDGHPVTGSISFRVTGAATFTTPLPDVKYADRVAAPGTSGGSWVWGLLTASALLLALAAYVLLRHDRRIRAGGGA